MRRLLPYSILVLTICYARAQSVPEAKKLMYYEKYQSASDMLQEILKRDKQNAEAWYLLTSCYLHNNQLTAIENSLKLIPNDEDNIAFIDCAKGELEMKRGKKEDAALLYKTALLHSKEKDPLILSAVAQAYI